MCQDCMNCRVKHWFMFCKLGKWKWEMLANSNLSMVERQVRPFLQVPDRIELLNKECEFYEGAEL